MLYQNHPLYYLIQIDNYQSLSLAAEHLYLSQPALSQAMKNLESELGLTLLKRVYQGISLTEDGKKVVELAKKGFAYFEQIETLAKSKTNTEKCDLNKLNIYANPAYVSLVLHSVVNTCSCITNIPIVNTVNDIAEVSQLFKNDPRTVALGIIPEDFNLDSQMGAIVLNQSKAYINYSRNFTLLAPNKTSISFKELIDLPLIISQSSFMFQKVLMEILETYGEPKISAVSPNYAHITYLIEQGVGVGFVNKLSHSTKSNLPFKTISIRNAPKFNLVLVYNNNTDTMAEIMELAKILKETI